MGKSLCLSLDNDMMSRLSTRGFTEGRDILFLVRKLLDITLNTDLNINALVRSSDGLQEALIRRQKEFQEFSLNQNKKYLIICINGKLHHITLGKRSLEVVQFYKNSGYDDAEILREFIGLIKERALELGILRQARKMR